MVKLKGSNGGYLNIDMWYGDKFEPKKYGADSFFSDMYGTYFGNIYDSNGKIIGDYSGDDSVLVEQNFLVKWNGAEDEAIEGATKVCANDDKKVDQLFKDAQNIVDYFAYHNKNLNKTQDGLIEDLSDAVYNRSTIVVREAISALKYHTKGMNNTQTFYIESLYEDFFFADGRYSDLGKNVDSCDDIKASTKLIKGDTTMAYKNGRYR